MDKIIAKLEGYLSKRKAKFGNELDINLNEIIELVYKYTAKLNVIFDKKDDNLSDRVESIEFTPNNNDTIKLIVYPKGMFSLRIVVEQKRPFWGNSVWHCLEISVFERQSFTITEIKYNGLDFTTYEREKDSSFVLGSCIYNSLYYDYLCEDLNRIVKREILPTAKKALQAKDVVFIQDKVQITQP